MSTPTPGRSRVQLQARSSAIAKLDARPVVRFWPAGLFPHHMGDPFRTPVDTIGHALQRAATENA